MKALKGKKLLALLLTLAMLLTMVPMTAFAADTSDYTYLAFTSDAHNTSSNSSATRLTTTFTNVATALGKNISLFGSCGDMGSASASASDFWAYAQNVINAADAKVTGINGTKHFLVCGNHEYSPGKFGQTTGSSTQALYTAAGGTFETDDFILYSLGSTSSKYTIETDTISALDAYLSKAPTDRPIIVLSHLPLHNEGYRTITGKDSVINTLNKYGNTHTIIFLWGHNHTDVGNGENHYDKFYTDKLDSTSIKFVYCAAGCMSDSDYSGSSSSGSGAVKGKALVIGVDKNAPLENITLTYYTETASVVASKTFSGGTSGSSEDPVTPTTGITYKKVDKADLVDGEYIVVADNDSDRLVALKHDKSAFIVTDYNDNTITVPSDADLIWTADFGTGNNTVKLQNGSNYLRVDNGSLSVGSTNSNNNWNYDSNGKMYLTVGSNNYALNYSSANSQSATIAGFNASKGKTTGCESFTFYEKVSGSSEDPVTPTGKTVTFTLTDKFELGKKYVIANANTGTVKLLANKKSDSFATESATISNNTITVSKDSSAIWEAKSTGTGDNLIGLYNSTTVLKINAQSTPKITTSGTSYNAGGFGYTSNSHVSYPYSNSTYYIGSDSTNYFKASNSENGLGKVYIFVEGTGSSEDPEPTTGNTIDVTATSTAVTQSAKIAVDETLTINLTNGSTNHTKVFTNVVANTAVAQITSGSSLTLDQGAKGVVTVKGLSEGNTTIELTGKSDQGYDYVVTINLTVGDGGSSEDPTPTEETVTFTPTDKFELGKKYVIANANNGTVKLLANNNSDSFATESATISNNTITVSKDSSAIWEAKSTGTGDNLIGLYNGSNVLKVDASSSSNPYIKTSATSYNAGGFGYTTNNHVSYPYGSPAKDYFIGSDSTNGFKASNSEPGLDKVYIFVEETGSGEDPGTPTGKTLEIKATKTTATEKSETIAVGETLTIKVTHDSQASKNFTNTVDKSTVAQITSGPTINGLAANTEGTVVVTGLAKGTATITLTGKNSGGSDYVAIIHLTVDDGGSSKPTKIAVPTPVTGLTYNGQPQIGVAAGTGYTLTNNTATNAGSYTATATLAEGYAWNDGSTDAASISWSIAKANATVKANDASKALGATDPTLTATVTGRFGSDTLSYSISRESGETVGTYTITPTGATDQGNYNVTYQTGTFTITSAKIDVPTAVTGLVYDGTTKTGVVAGTGYTLTNNTATNAGSYTATATLEGGYAWSDGSKTEASISWSIAKANATVKANDASKALGATDPTLTATVTGRFGSDTLSYSISRESGETVGTYTITPTGAADQGNYNVTYQTGTFIISEEPVPVLTGIEITTPPTKTKYFVGEVFDDTGMVVTASYDNSTTATVTGYTVEPSGVLSTAGTQEITVSYGGFSDTVNIEVVEAELVSIAVSGTYQTQYNEGQSFNPAGMVVTATYSDNSQQNVTQYSITPDGALTTSDNKVTVSYSINGVTKTAKVPITVISQAAEATLDRIQALVKPGTTLKTTYKAGESFDATNLLVMAYYSDGTSREVTNYYVTPSGALSETTTFVTIVYTEDGVTKYDYIGVTVEDDDDDDHGSGHHSDSGTTVVRKAKNQKSTGIFENTYDSCSHDSWCIYSKYTDLDTTKWYHNGIHFCVDNGLMKGISETQFDPEGKTTKGMMATIIARIAGEKADGTGATWYEAGIQWAMSKGITNGVTSDNVLTREDFAVMLYNYAKSLDKGFSSLWMFDMGFVDSDKVSDYASEAVHWCVLKGIMNGRSGLYQGYLDPQGNLTRAEAAVMIEAFCDTLGLIK